MFFIGPNLRIITRKIGFFFPLKISNSISLIIYLLLDLGKGKFYTKFKKNVEVYDEYNMNFIMNHP